MLPFATLICLDASPQPWLNWPDEVPLSGTNDVLLVRLSASGWANRLGTLLATLSADERQRANRFRQIADRQRFVMGRGGLRRLAGHLAGRAAETILFATGLHGKPDLVDANGWQANVTHAGDWVLIALAKQPVGVDLEENNPGFAYQELVPTCFGPPEERLLTAASQQSSEAARHLFYTLWTRKEAIIKATGIGITEQLPAISVLDGTQYAAASAIGAAGTWHIQSFAVADAYPAAVACQWPGAIHRFMLAPSPEE